MYRWGVVAALAAVIGAGIVTPPLAAAAPGVEGAINAAGGSCGAPHGNEGQQQCVLSGISFQLLPGEAWSQTTDLRKKACDGGWINQKYAVLTDGHWYVLTDHNRDLVTIQTNLAQQGVNADTRPYCP